MNKLANKFIVGIIAVLGLSCLGSLLFNTKFLERYYLYQKRAAVNAIHEKLADEIGRGVTSDEAIETLEESEKVILVQIDNRSRTDNDKINDKLRLALQEKGIGFQKYWLWEEDYNRILEGDTRVRLYRQENLNYSLLVQYSQPDTELFAIIMIIPNISDAFGIINRFLIFVNVSAMILAVIFIIVLIRQITKPLGEFKRFAFHMKNNEFVPIAIHTNDELADAADSLNAMGSQIMTYQLSLQEKNKQMERLLDDVAHELKTPVSLIQLYASGIRDGLDDGTFLDTILLENEQISHMINQLLYVSRAGKKPQEFTEVNLTALLATLAEEYSVLAAERDLTLNSSLEQDVTLLSSGEMMNSLFRNFLTNAIKYSSGPRIDFSLRKTESGIRFTVSNETDHTDLDLSQIWTPYYVGESSRSKNLSGTGLGLAIVDKICETLQYSIQCSLHDGWITFTLTIPFTD